MFAQGIEQLLLKRIGIPVPRPDLQTTGSIGRNTHTYYFVSSNIKNQTSPIKGSLSEGLKSLRSNKVERALAIRAGMQAGSLERKILAWAIAISGKKGVTSGTIADIANDLPNWPAAKTMAQNSERALYRETLSANSVISAFAGHEPQTVEGAIVLADAYLAKDQPAKARNIISPFWSNETLNKKTENKILAKFGHILNVPDHRKRMHTLFYNDRVSAAQRVAAKAEQFSLSKARTAAIRKPDNAKSLILGVAPASKKDAGYTFARIEYARRIENFDLAAKLLLSAPKDPTVLIEPDEWWVERRIVSRHLIETGNYKTAYKIAANHSAQSAKAIIDAEFHAGWYALRFLNDPATARKHFSRILTHATRPISKSRGYYWLARASKGEEATRHYREAANYDGTYYGQLALLELGQSKISISNPKPTDGERQAYRKRELVRVIKQLEAIDQDRWAIPFYLHLARTLSSKGELAILAANAEKQGNYRLSLQVGKIADGRNLKVDTLAWPIGAIPSNAKISSNNRALAYAISRQESAFDKAAVSHANARGLMQLLPGTAKGVAKRHGYKYSYKRLTRDAGYNATLGTAYLAEQMEKFGGSYILTFAAYNAGPRKAEEWIARFGDPRGKPLYKVIDWVEQIPYTETRNYVQRVMENYQMYKTRIGNSNLMISSDLKHGRR